MTTPRRPTRFYDMVPGLPRHTIFAVAEDHQDQRLAPLNERLVQAIWNEQLIKSDVLVTADGRPVKVFDPGQWNGEAGPDFRGADIAVGGQRCRGDIEIHVHSSEWDRHGHQKDFDYNGVILHVVLYRDDARAFDELHNGSYAPRLALEDFLEPDLETIRMTLAGEDYFHARRTPEQGPGCHLEVARINDGYLCELMSEAARERMETKVERYALQAANTSLDQALYQAIMTAMGHKGGKTLFFLLSRRAPLDDLKLILRNVPVEELGQTLESILLHVAGLAAYRSPVKAAAADMLNESAKGPLDSETSSYLSRSEDIWAQYERYFADRVIPPTRRWMTNIRPVNFPMRRIAGIARFLVRTGFRGSLVAWLADALRASAERSPRTAKNFQRELKALAELLTTEDMGFWSRHYTVGGTPAKSPMALIGQDRAMSVVFNAVLPVMLLHSRHMGDEVLEKYLWRLHDNFPALQENTITRFMRNRLFAGGPNRSGLNFRLEAQNQALIHIFHQCCANSDLTCEHCVFRRVSNDKVVQSPLIVS